MEPLIVRAFSRAGNDTVTIGSSKHRLTRDCFPRKEFPPHDGLLGWGLPPLEGVFSHDGILGWDCFPWGEFPPREGMLGRACWALTACKRQVRHIKPAGLSTSEAWLKHVYFNKGFDWGRGAGGVKAR